MRVYESNVNQELKRKHERTSNIKNVKFSEKT